MTHHAHMDLPKTDANFVALTPLSFLSRTEETYPDHPAVIYGDLRRDWRETARRCRQLASALHNAGLERGDVVGFMAVNTPELFEAHFGVPMAGMVLNALNYRLEAATIAYIIDHAEIKLLVTDREFSDTVKEAITLSAGKPRIIDIDDPAVETGELLGEMDYEAFITTGDPDFSAIMPADEWDSISINYTSGTTGNPKGVVYSHRGAYLNALGNAVDWDMPFHPTYLWTLPMFHCNGWCFAWTLAAKAGTSVCIRKVTAANIYNSIADHGVDHFCGAPVVLSFVINATEEERRKFTHKVKGMTAAAPPPAKVLQAMQEQGFEITHAYGLTETYGPCVLCAWHEEWNDLPIERQANLKARQGMRYTVQEGLDVLDADTMQPVVRDAEAMGEAMMRGNIVMKGYLKNPEATETALAGGWFHSGDLGVMHPDNYLQLRDRAKDIIISGGENISSIEVEDALFKHDAIAACAVVAKPDDKWGEVPCAFIELKPGKSVTAEELLAHCRGLLAGYKMPKDVRFEDLPKTSTGKIQKVELRKRFR